MASMAELRERIAELVELVEDDALTVYAYVPESAPNLPAVVIQPAVVTFEDTTNHMGLDTYEFDLQVLVAWGDGKSAQDALDVYLAKSGPQSIRQILRDHRDLDYGDGTNARVDRADYGITFGREQELPSFGAMLRLVVRTNG